MRITDNGIEEDAHIQERNLVSEIVRIQRDKLEPISFLRARDFQILEKCENGKPPFRIALLNLFSKKTGENYLNKIGLKKY